MTEGPKESAAKRFRASARRLNRHPKLVDSVLHTILFTDLVGFSGWALEAGDRQAVGLLRQFSESVEPAVSSNRGEVVKRLATA